MGLFHHSHTHYDNPADSAMPYLEQIPGQITPYYNPYIQQGQNAYNQSQPVYNQMVSNPQDYYNNIMSGYTPSAQYQYNLQQGLDTQKATAASGGFAGTTFDQANQAAIQQGLLSQDEQNYYNNVAGAQRYGLGANMDYYNQGYNASNTLANSLGQNLAAEAGLQYQGTAFQNQMKAQQQQNRFGLLGTVIGAGAGYAGSRNQPNYNYYGPGGY